MKQSDPEANANARTYFYGFSVLVFLVGIILPVSEWVCLLAALEPRVWMPIASVARWIYAVALLILIAMFLLRHAVLSAFIPSTLSAFLWSLLAAICHAVAVYALFDENFSLVLVLEFGWGAFSAVQKWLLPDEKEKMKMKRYRRTDAIAQGIFFVVLVATLELHSVWLSLLLFPTMMVYLTVSLLWMRQETLRSESEQK